MMRLSCVVRRVVELLRVIVVELAERLERMQQADRRGTQPALPGVRQRQLQQVAKKVQAVRLGEVPLDVSAFLPVLKVEIVRYLI